MSLYKRGDLWSYKFRSRVTAVRARLMEKERVRASNHKTEGQSDKREEMI